MVHRYFRLLEFISDDGTLADFLPGPAANRRLRKFLDDISKIESVSKELQSSSVMLGCIWTDYWSYTRHSPPTSKLPLFIGQQKKRRNLKTRTSKRYQLISAISPTSNHVERLYSTTKATLGTQRHSLRPDTLEMIVMLRANEAFWNAQGVIECT
ncbi:hypothetical protein JG687_00015325 [Phytophthora cactorum]|uniref:Uncharacterized protein n=1 Tax=Phytophthora cactorum TaxID=29920 RepID=A0A8T1TW95_9STRA|nr:Ribonuclease H-like domain [Phytophthora cactorum]KAG6948682.1 hypothetical protein JG687_00015325 [Phytophthora cactorum]